MAKFSGHYLRRWRQYRGLTQEQLAEAIGRTHATIQRIETRQVALTQPTLDELARALNVPRGKILDELPPAKK